MAGRQTKVQHAEYKPGYENVPRTGIDRLTHIPNSMAKESLLQ